MKHRSRIGRLAPAVAAPLVACLIVSGTGAAATPAPARRPLSGASGSVAAIGGSSIEVQNPQSGQVTVSFGPTTTFTRTVAVAASAVTVGECVTATGSPSKGVVVATAVTISPASSGGCTGGLGRARGAGFGGARGAGAAPPGGFARPGGGVRPGARGFPGRGGFGFASGKVTRVSSTSLVVTGFSSADLAKATAKSTKSTKSTKSAKPTGKKSGRKSARVAQKATTVRIDLTGSTTYRESQGASAADLAVGDCVSASGTTDSTGAVTASAVRIVSTGGGTCTGGFGGFRGGPGG